ncbi:MAG: hypothetical protein AAB332_03440 [Planctomycetota bacterium]
MKFEKGKSYTRKDISGRVRGGIQDCLPHFGNEVVAICMKQELNPSAPNIMLVGKGRDKIKYSEILCGQTTTVPIFIKRAVNDWQCQGYYKPTKHTKDPNDIIDHGRTSHRKDIYMVIHFEEAKL